MSTAPGRLDGQVCLVTGAARGIGQQIAVEFCRNKAKVVILLDVDDCTETEKLASSTGESVIYTLQCDLKQGESHIQQALETLWGESSPLHGKPLNVLVNNAAKLVCGSVETLSDSDWDDVLGVNVRGTAQITKCTLPYMKLANHQSDSKSIVMIGSISSFKAQPACVAYSTSKAAIVQMCRNFAYDLAKYHIRVNAVCPGTIETPLSVEERQQQNWSFEDWEQRKVKDVMLGRVGTATEVAKAVLFFASNESSYCTGSHLMVDGGQYACTVAQPRDHC